MKYKHAIDYYAERDMDEFWHLQRNWDVVKELVRILRIPYEATLRFQKANLCMSDVYAIWLEIGIHLQRLEKKTSRTSLASQLNAAIHNRQRVIFKNNATICCVFLDPRLRSEITKHNRLSTVENAKTHLKELWRRLEVIKNSAEALRGNETATEADNSLLSSNSKNSINDSFEAARDLQLYLNSSDNPIPTHSPRYFNKLDCSTEEIDSVLDSFDPEWLPLNQSVLSFWENKKDSDKILYELAMAVYAIPPTEVQIERDFSHLEYILTKNRMRLSQEMLEAILTTKLNPEIFYMIKREELENILDA